MRGVMGSREITESTNIRLEKVHKDFRLFTKHFPNEPLKAVVLMTVVKIATLAKSLQMYLRQMELKCICFSAFATYTLNCLFKYLGCQCGIVLTASHNPPEYNGYKVYWQDGDKVFRRRCWNH
jgi:phosphomannomutase